MSDGSHVLGGAEHRHRSRKWAEVSFPSLKPTPLPSLEHLMKSLVATDLTGFLAFSELLFQSISNDCLNFLAQILSRPLLRNHFCLLEHQLNRRCLLIGRILIAFQ